MRAFFCVSWTAVNETYLTLKYRMCNAYLISAKLPLIVCFKCWFISCCMYIYCSAECLHHLWRNMQLLSLSQNVQKLYQLHGLVLMRIRQVSATSRHVLSKVQCVNDFSLTVLSLIQQYGSYFHAGYCTRQVCFAKLFILHRAALSEQWGH